MSLNSKQPKVSDITIPLVLALICIYVYFAAQGMRPEASMFPVRVSVVTFGLCLMLAGNSVYRMMKNRANSSAVEAASKRKTKHRNFWITVALIVAYPLLILLVGYFPAYLIYMFASLYFYNYRNLKVAIPTTVGLMLFIYLLFVKILMVKLPIGVLFGGELY